MFDFLNPKNLGKDYKGFILLSIDELPDYKTKAVYLRHKRTGLEVYHILAEDKENTFAFAFRTLAKDSKGCAHIMEHSTLCGSEKYPLKEPFTTLASQSLNTFLNAMTYPDKTVYPAASVVRSDYFTMFDVYADAVFFPKLDYETFIQEGHRLEMDEEGKLSVQGVVYNEMKGNYSAFMDIAIDEQIKAMYPDSFPAFDSGGDPLVIPSLTYKEFLDFHQKFYNPDNCLLYLYGDIPTSDQLDYFDEHFISRIEEKYNCHNDLSYAEELLPVLNPEIKQLQELKLIKESTEIRAIAPETGATGSVVALNWYSGESNTEKKYLSEVLCGNDSSPLSKRLKASKLGDDLAPIWNNFGLMQQEFFSYGLSGVKKGDEGKVYKLVQDSIKQIYEKDEISQEDIDSAVMGIDFSLREVTRYSGPYSLVLMSKVLKGWSYGKACNTYLSPITDFEKVKENIRNNKDYTKSLIRKYFLDNEVCVKVVVEPSPEYIKERNKTEAKLIENLGKNLDKNKLKKDLEALHKYQQHIETPEETACIPHTKISELDRNIDLVKTELKFVKGSDNSEIPVFVNEENTNGIFYLDVLFPFDRLEPKYYQHIPTISTIVTNMGWGNKPWDECIAESACVMGDVWGRTLCGSVPQVEQCQKYAEEFKQYNFMGRNWLGMTCKALTSQAKETLNIFTDIITKMDFSDKKRFETLLQEIKADNKESIIYSGRDYALKRARASISKSLALSEIMWGISQLYTISEYKKKNIPEILKTFEYIYTECRKAGGILHITADSDSLKILMPMLEEFAKNAELTELKPAIEYSKEEYEVCIRKSENLLDSKGRELIKVETQTGYAIAVSPASKCMTKEAAAENVFTSWFSMHSLWDKIRTTGGAYGAGSWTDNMEGYLGMYTYRDPNPVQSLQVYLESLKEMAEANFDEEDIERTVVSNYGGAITPVAPKDRGARGFEGMVYANPQEFRLIRIDQLLSIKADDVQSAAKRLYESTKNALREEIFCDKSVDSIGKNLRIPL